MSRRTALAVVALAVGAVLALAAAPRGPSASASASAAVSAPVSTGHRAAVVVDLGNGQVKVGCVSFTEDHISGLEALDRASMAPVAQTYGGQGSAVCALCGKGCTAGSTCLTCKAPNYWAYFHDGTYSSISASRSEVRDGDTEGWKWGKGERPANVPFDQVCLVSDGPHPTSSPTTGPATPSTQGTRPSTPTTSTGSGAPGPSQNGGSVPSTPASRPTGPVVSAVAPTRPRTTTPSASTTSSIPPNPSSTAAPKPGVAPGDRAGTGTGGDGPAGPSAIGSKHVVIERAGASTGSPAARSGNGGHSPLLSILTFGAAIAVLTGLIVAFRRRRVSIE